MGRPSSPPPEFVVICDNLISHLPLPVVSIVNPPRKIQGSGSLDLARFAWRENNST